MGATCCTLGDGGAAAPTSSRDVLIANGNAKHHGVAAPRGLATVSDITVAASVRRLLEARCSSSRAVAHVDAPQVDDSSVVAWRSNIESLLPLLTAELQEALSANATAGLLQTSRSAAAARLGAQSSVGSSGATHSASTSLSLDGCAPAVLNVSGSQDLLQLHQKLVARDFNNNNNKRTSRVVECCYFFAFDADFSTRAEALPDDLGSASLLERDSDDDNEVRRSHHGSAPPQEFSGVGPAAASNHNIETKRQRHTTATAQGTGVGAPTGPSTHSGPLRHTAAASTSAGDGDGVVMEVEPSRLVILSSSTVPTAVGGETSSSTHAAEGTGVRNTTEPSMASFTNAKPFRGLSSNRSATFFTLPRVMQFLKFLLRQSRYTAAADTCRSRADGGDGGLAVSTSARKASCNSNNSSNHAIPTTNPKGKSATGVTPLADPRRASNTRSRGAVPHMHHCTFPVDAAALPFSALNLLRPQGVGVDYSAEASNRIDHGTHVAHDEHGRRVVVAVSAVFLTHDVADMDCQRSGAVTLSSRRGAVLEGVLFLHCSEDAGVVAKLSDEEDELLQQYCVRVPLEGAVRNFLSNVYQTTVA